MTNKEVEILATLAYEIKSLTNVLKNFDGFTGEIQHRLKPVANSNDDLSMAISNLADQISNLEK